MFLGFRAAVLAIALSGALPAAALRVCADPNNLPYSNMRQQGFENALATLVAGDLGLAVGYVWEPQRGRYLRKTLDAGKCDVVMGIATGVDEVATTRPYYRSSYVFVSRHDRRLGLRSFDAPVLRKSRIGVHVLQHEDATTPPVQVLLTRGLAGNIEWFKLYPDFSRPNPASALIEAVEHQQIDVAVAWGPMAGYFAKSAPVPLDVVPVPNQVEQSIPLAYNISMGVRHGDARLLAKLNAAIDHRKDAIRQLLQGYGVPLVEER
jgi:quinoprotein dehydrogenase-associated probable ABC transporter substrate-binding protein